MKITYFIGIDISKDFIDVAYNINNIATKFSHHQFSNNEKGFTKMMEWIEKDKIINLKESVFLMEHTGIYALPLCCFMEANNLNYVLESSLKIKRSMGIIRDKNDKADAKMLASYAYLYKDRIKLTKLPSNALLKLKNLIAYRKRLTKQLIILKKSIKQLESIQSLVDSLVIIEDSLKHKESIEKSIKHIDKEIENTIKSDKEIENNYRLASSVKGVGLIVAASMIIYTHNFTLADSSRKFACYSGIAPFQKQSGISIKGRTKVSHIANKKMKTLLGNAANCAIVHDKELSLYYKRKREEGKPHLLVINAVKNKIVSRVFATIKRQTPYVELMKFACC